MTRTILHVDMDAFYASVEQLDDPGLRGRPVIVGADPKGGHGRGVVAACSYEARKFGVRSALPISRAWKLCPEGAYLRPRMDRYADMSHQVMDILRRFSNLVEPLSIDEAFVDITGSMALFGSAEQIGKAIKKQIWETTGLCASVGAGPNKFVAKIASDLRKPNALVVIESHQVEEFLRDLPISRLWGVGPKTEARLHEIGLRTIGDVRNLPAEKLARLGSMGEHLHQLSSGIDDRPVVPHWEPKSISSETTFEEDTADAEVLLQTIRRLSGAVGRRLRREDYRTRRIALKLRYENFETHTRQVSLDRPVQGDDDIARLATSLFRQFPLNRKIRLIGVGAGELMRTDDGRPVQLDLFAGAQNRDIVDHTVDQIRNRFGETSVLRGSQLNSE